MTVKLEKKLPPTNPFCLICVCISNCINKIVELLTNKNIIMKRIITFSILLLSFGFIIFNQSCSYDKCNETIKYQVFNPVYMTKTQLRNITVEEATPLEDPGKIYVYGKYLFINELYKGVHIYDNSDKSNPINISFISIPGNVDMAVKDEVLYTDNFFDLISFDISDPKNPKYISSVENIFNINQNEISGIGYLVYYNPSNVFEEIDCSNSNFGESWFGTPTGEVFFDAVKLEGGSSGATNFGVGGSMARFTIMNNRLYTVDNFDLNVFNIETASNPIPTNKINVGWGIETIFPLKDKLFIGSNSGMFIFGTEDADNPKLLSSFSHATSCDPVFVVGDIAYVTLRSGTRCLGFTNQIDVIDIKNLLSPKLLKTYPMDNPHGLSVIDNKMILCEGEFGLKIIDVEDPLKLKTKTEMSDNHYYDVIGLNKDHIIMIGADGLYQYKMDGFDLLLLGSIQVAN